MSDLAITRQTASLLLHTGDDTGNSLGMSMPFPTTITLHEDITIAGTTHVKNIDQILENVELPFPVEFVRDPGNIHDAWAIKVMLNGKRVGFVPCDVNEVLARLMDGGKRLDGRVFEKEQLGRWTKLHMEVNLVD